MAVDTRTALLDAAQELAQERGLNAFSFSDLASRLHIKKASIHYHFPSKADLAREIVVRYRERFDQELRSISSRHRGPKRRLSAFITLFQRTLSQGSRICLCGMLASEFTTLPDKVQREVQVFFENTERWLIEVLSDGRRRGAFAFSGSVTDIARNLLAMLEGAMITSRTFSDERRFRAAGKWLVASIENRAH